VIEQAGRPQKWANGTRGRGAGDDEANGNARGLWAGYGAIPFHPVDRADGTSAGTGGATDCVVNCNNQHSVYGFHAGGAHVLFCDGSVRFVGEKLDARTFALLVTRDDGEALGAGDY
jgi:prepilin-type processing-associated H-X9-DG protein